MGAASTANEKTRRIRITPVTPMGMGGGLEGAERNSRELMTWSPSMRSPDQIINGAKPLADARGRDIIQNDGYATGAVATHRDSIVGAVYRLNAQPNWRVLGADEAWAEEFQQVVEARMNLLFESPACWIDAARMNTLTGLVRLAVGGFVMTGEVLATSEWLKPGIRPLRTAIQMVSPDRLSNPDGRSDDRFLRRGIRRDVRGRPLGYFIRRAHPSEYYDDKAFEWVEVPSEKPWGRQQVIHIIEQLMPDQSRGIADMVAVLKQMKMTKQFQEITLQNAVINASFAAAIESELPPEVVYNQLGGGQTGMTEAIAEYMTALKAYLEGASSIQIDGAKIPHLFPGTKLNLKPMGQPGGVGTEFEESLQRNIAKALGISYEEFSADYSKTSYSSARASMNNTWRFMQARKKIVADRFATAIYALVLEEEIAAGNVPLPAGKTRNHFYEPLMKEAYCACSWIGAARGQIDELKETQAALLKIRGGLSTREKEIAKLGEDWREVFAQQARERKVMEEAGLTFNTDAERDDSEDGQTVMSGGDDNRNTSKEAA